jgi:transcription elongation factor Elf1
MTMNFIGIRNGFRVYDFSCPVCDAGGELSVSSRAQDWGKLVECPDCGAQFKQRASKGMFSPATLEYAFGGKL